MLDKIDALALEAQRINDKFHRLARTTYQFTRKQYADPKYEAFRDSDEGRAWKKQKLAECNNRCPECHKLISDNNSNIDHKHPRRYHPWLAWDVNNLWVMCRDCNLNKSDMEWDEYLYAVKIYRGQAAVNRILKYAPSASSSYK
jgi:5-methylcytosine-specific restriction endonuclease McrA